MADQEISPTITAITRPGAARKAGRKSRGRKLLRSLGRALAASRLASPLIVSMVGGYLRLVHATNQPVTGLDDVDGRLRQHAPFICALWHGQHLMAPILRPKNMRVWALFSRSADAELNARVATRLGLRVVRGSGGREGRRTDPSKGGARALIKLKRVLDEGDSVAMIADIPNGTPREAGEALILLAKLTGRPIVPAAYASSRYKIIEKSWDKTTVPLPFGRSAALAGEPVFVPPDADEATIEAKRVELTARLNAITAQAYALAEHAR